MKKTNKETHSSSSSEHTAIKKFLAHKKATPLFAAIILLIIIALAGFFGYKKYQMLIEQNQLLMHKTDEITETLAKQEQSQQTLINTIEKLSRNSNMSYYINLLATTGQLTTAANITLKTENNIEKALNLLNIAQQHIAHIHEFEAIRNALEKDIAALKAVSVTDQEKTLLQLNKLVNQVSTLEQVFAPTTNTDSKETTTEASATATATTTDEKNTSTSRWHRILHNVAHSLRNIVTISHKENLPMALTSQQLINLKINLQALLLEASWALSYHQNKVYQAALKETANLLQIYFPANESVKNSILPTIQELQQTDVGLKPINVDKSLEAIETTLEQQSVVNISSSESSN